MLMFQRHQRIVGAQRQSDVRQVAFGAIDGLWTLNATPMIPDNAAKMLSPDWTVDARTAAAQVFRRSGNGPPIGHENVLP